MSRSYWLEHAVIDGVVLRGVRLVEDDGTIVERTIEQTERPEDVVVRGLAIPGFANAHSHAFHRALRGRVDDSASDFWSWRTLMYDAVARLDLDRYRRLATAVFSEMVLAGYTAVGEFHYVHHRSGGRPHDEANAMGEALCDAARAAGIRLTLLDAMYFRGGLDLEGRPVPLAPAQRQFSDGDADSWLTRHDALAGGPGVRIGAAVHSVRAVDVRRLGSIVSSLRDQPVHAHVSEQPAENRQADAAYGMSPVAALEAAGLLGPHFTAVHATHLTVPDIGMLARTGSLVCFCPTTERDLADGIGPAGALDTAGVRLTIGSDQHVVIDPFDELRALEGHERLATGRRGHFTAGRLLEMGTTNGQASLGWGGGRLAPGAPCDVVAIDVRSIRTAGVPLERAWMSASGSDVRDVVIAGERIVSEGRHRLGDVGSMLAAAVAEIFA